MTGFWRFGIFLPSGFGLFRRFGDFRGGSEILDYRSLKKLKNPFYFEDPETLGIQIKIESETVHRLDCICPTRNRGRSRFPSNSSASCPLPSSPAIFLPLSPSEAQCIFPVTRVHPVLYRPILIFYTWPSLLYKYKSPSIPFPPPLLYKSIN